MKLFTERKIYTVTEITREIKGLLESNFSDLWVQGEVSNFRAPSSGHYYFTLKDQHSQLKAVCFKMCNMHLKFKLEDGLSVLARGRISAYEPRGDYQMIAEYIEPVGLGSLQLAFEQLKERLRKAGLFDETRKRPLPLLPRKIGIVTSPTGAALRDILRILKRRNKNLNVLIYPSRVQGEGAAEEITEGIRHLNRLQDIDVIIIGRGGGSIEDLWAFNEEIVARAIYDSRIPIVSAVGHEIDFTIADFVADLRAPTPSAAAELVSGALDDLKRRVDISAVRLKTTIERSLDDRRTRLQLLRRSRGFDVLPAKLREHSQQVDEATYRLNVIMRNRLVAGRNKFALLHSRSTRINLPQTIDQCRQRLVFRRTQLAAAMNKYMEESRKAFELQMSKLNALSPLTVLGRGYAICRKEDGTIVKRASQVVAGERVSVSLAKGKLQCQVVGNKDGT